MKPQKLFYILLVVWLIVDLLQAVFSPIHADEAYYSLYGDFLNWGFYDHPPMIALMTALSKFLFNGNLSIRFITVIIHALTILLVWETISCKSFTARQVLLFFAIAASLPMFSIYGFITTPDAPLLFFTALFFFFYKKYVENNAWSNALGLTIAQTGMLYSKYMAVLVLGFTVLSNIKLLKDYKFLAACLIAVVLFIPHILWQINNNFPSLQYHLIDRNSSFKIQYPLEYFPYQMLVFNPICLCLALYICWKKRNSANLFEKSCVYTVSGFVLFFWIMTVKGHAEPHWTVAASVPMIALLFSEIQKIEFSKLLKFGILPVVFLLVLLRISIPIVASQKDNFLSEEKTLTELHNLCGGTPVAFVGSFQYPSLYRYYTKENSFALSSLYSRRTQFDLLKLDAGLQGKPLYFVTKYYSSKDTVNSHIIDIDNTKHLVKHVDNFQGSNRLEVLCNNYEIINDTVYLELTIKNPYNVDYDFNHPEFPSTLHAAYKLDEYFTITCPIPDKLIIPARKSVDISTRFKYFENAPLVMCIDNSICRPVNSSPIILRRHD